MKYLKIQNDGLLDIRLVALMGGTTKGNDKYKIGQFGTGLKYTLAYLYRENIDFNIFTGTQQINITTEKELIKDTEFEIICIEGHRTSITTSMGHQWNAWMIIRELWCNALDEGSQLKEIVNNDSQLVGEENKTTFYIQINADIQRVLDEWRSYFIQGDSPLWENERYAIYQNRHEGNLRLYKHGVLIYQSPDYKSLFVYDIKDAEINELREFKGSIDYEIFNSLREPNDVVISHFLNNIKDTHYEGSQLEYGWFNSFSTIWKDTIGGSKIAKHGNSGYYSERGVDVDFSNVIELPEKVYKALTKSFEGIGALVMIDNETEFFEIPNARLKQKIIDCIELLAQSGYNTNPEVIFRYGVFSGVTQIACSRNKRTIMISEVCLKLGDEQICSFLIEYNEYVSTFLERKNGAFLRHMVDLYAKKILEPQLTEQQDQ